MHLVPIRIMGYICIYTYIPYEEVKENINKVLREQHYDKIINENAKKLVISNDINNIY